MYSVKLSIVIKCALCYSVYMKKSIIMSALLVALVSSGLVSANKDVIPAPQKTTTVVSVEPVPAPMTAVEPVVVQNTTPVVDTPLIEPIVYPTYNELMTQYNFSDEQHLSIVIDSLKTKYPERFTPENIEQSFAHIDEVFKPTIGMERDKQATIQRQLLAQFTW